MRTFQIAAAQAPALPMGTDLAVFEDQAVALLRRAPHADLLAFPEVHLFGPTVAEADARREELLRGAIDLDGPLVARLQALAARLGVWLVPGTLVERGPDGTVFNTAVVLGPDGALAGVYRKVFPWRPYEPYRPGNAFTVVDIPGRCRLGISICYDAWFPEVTRHLAWYGADVVLNLVRTTSDDRAQELVLARANSIVNQVFTVSVNCAGPEGRGQSIVTDPEGTVLAQSPDARDDVLVVDLDLDRIDYTRTVGTAGVNRVWSQFHPDDAPIPLPLYAGRIDPATWQPSSQHAQAPASASTESEHLR